MQKNLKILKKRKIFKKKKINNFPQTTVLQ